jgi:integrase
VTIRARMVGDESRRYDVRYRRGGRYFPVEHGGTFTTQREARIRRDLVAGWLAAGLDPKVELARILAPADSIAELQQAWLESRRRIAHSTKNTYGYHAKRIGRDLGEIPASGLTVARIIRWVGELERDYLPGTVRIYVQQLRMILDFAGVPNVARDRRVEIPRDIRREPNPPEAHEVVDAIRSLDEELALPLVAMEQLGSRISETLALTRDDLDEGRVRFRREEAKHRRGRWVAAKPELVSALMVRLPFGLSATRIQVDLSAIADFSSHGLRHRRASLWNQQGVDPVELARRLGHARPSVSLDIYSHVKPLSEIPAHELRDFLA